MDHRAFVPKIFYAVLLAPLRPKQSTSVQFRSAPFQNKPLRALVRSIANLVHSAIPWIASGLSRWMYRNNRFPWAPVDSELIASGSGAAVFKLEGNG